MYRILDLSRLGCLDGDFESPAAAYAELERRYADGEIKKDGNSYSVHFVTEKPE